LGGGPAVLLQVAHPLVAAGVVQHSDYRRDLWVHNVRAAGGRAVLRHGRREAVKLKEVAADARAPILRRYLSLAPGPRAFIPVDPHAPDEEFEEIAPRIPVFRVTTEQSAREPRD
jgi:uncharacterized protein (DUF2236 family)